MSQVNFAEVPSGVSISEGRINELNAATVETAGAFARKLESLTSTYAEARDRFSRDAEALVSSAGDEPETRRAADQLAKRRLAQQVISYRRSLVEASAGDRKAMLGRLKALADEAAAIGALFSSPAQMLGRVALGEPRKTQLIHQLEGAGPTELETAARTAIMSGDIVLSSAIAVVVDRRPRDRRPFALTDFAQRAIGEAFADVRTKLDAIALAHRTAVAADLEFQRGAPDPLTNMSLALASRSMMRGADR